MSWQQSSIKSSDGVDLFFRYWKSDTPSQLNLYVLHGLLEHGGRYEELPRQFLKRGISVNLIVPDLRGHGLSGGLRGHVDDFSVFIKDHLYIYNSFKEFEFSPEKTVFLGHSTGGLLLGLWFSKAFSGIEVPKVSSLVFSSPAFALSMELPSWKKLLSKLITNSIFGKLGIPADLNHAHLSHDEVLVEKAKNDKLSLDKITPILFDRYQYAMELMRKGEFGLDYPSLFLLAGDDRIVSLPRSLELYEKLKCPIKEKIIYENAFHEVLFETIKDDVYDNLVAWLKSTSLNESSGM